LAIKTLDELVEIYLIDLSYLNCLYL